jgi:MFS family permease
MMAAQILFMLQSFTMALLVLFNAVEVWHIITLSLLFGIISAFDAPARHSLVIDLIDKPEDLGNAIALNSAIFNAGRLVGPAIAGMTIAIVGEGICFLINAASFLAVIFALYKIRVKARHEHTGSTRFKESFAEGFKYTFQSVPIRNLIFLLALLSLVGFPFLVLLPAYAKEILHGESGTLGIIMSALGAGSFTGAIYMAGRRTVIGLGKIISWFCPLMGVAIILTSLTDNLMVSLGLFFIGGLGMIMSLAAVNTMMQTIADEDKRGRVMSFYSMALMGTTPMGNLLAGSIASKLGITYTLLVGGICTVLIGIWFAFKRPQLRKYIRPIYITKGIIPPGPDEM